MEHIVEMGRKIHKNRCEKMIIKYNNDIDTGVRHLFLLCSNDFVTHTSDKLDQNGT